jgi:3-dehydroquinate synthetase
LARHGLPTALDPSVPTSAILAAMGRDKKADPAALNMVLLDAPGSPHIRQDPAPAVIAEAIEELRATGTAA